MGFGIQWIIEVIMSFFGYTKKENVCSTCKALETQIVYLKALVERLVSEKESERAEYKRAVDVILYQKNTPAIGQGYTEPNKVLDTAKLLGFMEEEAPRNEL